MLRESAGINAEALETAAETPAQLYQELLTRYNFPDQVTLKVAVNDEFGAWDTTLSDGDRLVFIPPVAGG